jgi:glutamate-1-semialdehyde 2,1-aminomutase
MAQEKMTKRWQEAQKHLVGGVDSPVRAFKNVGGEPVFVSQALGPFIYDEEGKKYTDFCMSWGAILLGHADAQVIEAISDRAAKGTSFGTATTLEVKLARAIKKYFPSIDKLRFTSSGTEAAMGAIRLARGATGASRILKFEGCYHGHSDSLLVKSGSGLATFGAPDSAGVPEEIAGLTSVLPYNDAAAAQDFLHKEKNIACIIIKPVTGNMGVVPATEEFLNTLRSETAKRGILLIFDEVITGFRLTTGGAQHLYAVQPDITVLGKIIGGGLPVGAFGARKALMDQLSPLGKVYQAGTLSGNPLSMTAGLAVLSRISSGFYKNRIKEQR